MFKALVTAGPTRERIDPVRYISNFSSGKQGVAIAKALAEAGGEVSLVLGPCALDVPSNIKTINVETAEEMLKACEQELPVDVAICAAAVCDWRVKEILPEKLKKQQEQELTLSFVKNPDILAHISEHHKRPKLVVGFAAETQKLETHAREKLKKKGCDWIVANDVSNNKVFGSDYNQAHLFMQDQELSLDRMDKKQLATFLVGKITSYLKAD
jgi:phosphopantothenoylcysteine decarboxylase/phosphopantothenate--cysteine ligase